MSEQWGRPRWDEPPPPQPDRQLISNYEAHQPTCNFKSHYDRCGLANTLYLFTLAIVTGGAVGLLLWKILAR